MRKYLLLLSAIIISLTAQAQNHLLKGRVSDQANRTISYAAVYIKNSTYGTVANEEGKYQLKLAPGTYNVVYRFVGYKEVTEKITISDQNVYHNVQLTDENYVLKKFSSDSAMDIVRKVIDKREYFLNQVKKYSCVAFVKGVQKLDNPVASRKYGACGG